MAKVLKDAALIVGVVAIGVATAGVGTFGAAAAAAAASAASAVGLASAAALAGALSLGAAALSVGAMIATKTPKPIINPMQWQSDPQAGLPIVAGRAYTGGKIVYRNTYQKNNEAETIITVYSIGPVKEVEGLYVDSVLTTQNGITVNINDRGHMYASTQLGAQPEPKQLGDLGPPNYTTASKLSGLCASSITFTYDTSGGHTLTTEPQVGYVIQGVRVYDPRQDSTYPGGAANGPQRWNDETTWTYAGYDNPYLFALAWLIGWHQNGKLVAGVGVSTSAILLDQFVEGANVADANAWKMGGVLDSTDDKWSRLKDILQAGGGVPMRLGAQIGCMINTPKTSLATVTVDDVIGDASVQATQAQRDRINAIVPRYMAELDNTVADPSQPADSDGNHPLITNVTWAMVAASPVVVSDYVTFDGKQRQKQVDYTFVQNLTQSQQLARYDIENSREFGPITLPLKLRWMGYKPGDVVTCNLPELGLNGQDILLLQRELSPQDMTVTMTARSETYAKHAFALGQTGTPPATPSVSGPALIPTPGNAAWEVTGGTIASDNGTAQPVIEVIGAVDSSVIDAVVFQYRTSQSDSTQAGPWIDAGSQPPTIEQLNIFGLKDGGIYDVSVAYRKGSGTGTPLILGPATCGQTAIPYQTGVVGDKPPVDADNTASAYASASGGQTIQQVTVSIDSLTTKVQDLVATYGDTESAGAAASAAQAAENAAQAAQANAGTARDQAQAAFTAADAARQTAASAAGSASTYADGAASSADNAGIAASAAHESEVSASTAAAQLFPSAMQAGAPFVATTSGSPTTLASAVVPDSDYSGGILTLAPTAAFLEVCTVGVITPVPGRTYDVEVKAQINVAASPATPHCISTVQFVGLDSTYNETGSFYAAAPVAGYASFVDDSAADGWRVYKVRYTAATGDPAFVRPRFYGNYNGGSGAQPNAGYQVAYFKVADVTEMLAAQGSAAAAASSASSAGSSQTAAGNSASAANTSATNAATSAGQASTFAGNASTSANNASTSATNASGSANQASTYASQAAGSASGAAGSATSAATQASNAQSSATAAGASATSATTSANNAQGYSSNASTSAGSAQSSAAAASGSASAAQQSATLSASIGPGVLNANPSFAIYSAPTGTPDGWASWNYTGGVPSRVAGLDAVPYSCHFDAASGANDGIFQSISAAAGKYVVEVTADLTSGTWDGAGISIQWNNVSGSTTTSIGSSGIVFLTGADTAGYVGNNGARRSWSTYIDTGISGSINQFLLYAMANWDGFGTAVSAKGVTFRSVRFRPAAAPEIAGQQALPMATTAIAQISTETSARVSADSALASRIDSLTTTVGGNSSSITSLQTTVASNAASAAQQVSTVTAFASANPNLIADVTNWSIDDSGIAKTYASTWGPYLLGYPTGLPAGYYQRAHSPRIGVDAGTSYALSADLLCLANGGSADQVVYCQARQYDANGNYISDLCSTNQTASANFSDDNPARKNYWGTGTTASNAVSVEVEVWAKTDSGQNYPVIGIRQVKFERGSTPSAYSLEGQTASLSSSVSILTATTSNLAARVNTAVFQVTAQAGTSRGLLNITADGYGASSIDLVAGSINLYSQNGANTAIKALAVDSNGNVSLGSDLYLSNGRIVQNNGSVMKVQGTGFGTSNQFIEWFGPTMAISSCSEANATFYLKVDGSAYFGGTLSAGVIKNSSQSTDTSATALCVIGPFSTNGKAKNVVCSYTYKHFYTCNSRTGTSSGSGSSQVTIERSTDSGGTWATVTTLNAAGSTSIVVDGQPGVPDQVTYTASGSTTFTDNTGATATMMLRMRVSARSEPALGGSGISGTLISQNMSIVSTE